MQDEVRACWAELRRRDTDAVRAQLADDDLAQVRQADPPFSVLVIRNCFTMLRWQVLCHQPSRLAFARVIINRNVFHTRKLVRTHSSMCIVEMCSLQ